MMKNISTRFIALGIPFLIILVMLSNGLFVVTQGQQALVLQFGELIRTQRDPGLHYKIPFVQNVVYYDKRMLDFDISTIEMTLGDQKRLVVDLFMRYRIKDPAQFYRTVTNEAGARARLSAQVTGLLRSALSKMSLAQMLSAERMHIRQYLHSALQHSTQPLGIEVAEVRLRRALFPRSNNQAIFDRMITEREREAKGIRAQGEEMAYKIRAAADREKTVLIASARRKSKVLRGEGEAEAARLYNTVYAKNIEFASYYLNIQALMDSFADQTTFLLSTDSACLKMLHKSPLAFSAQP